MVAIAEVAELIDLMTPEAAAKLLAVSYKAVVGWCLRGDLPALKVGRLWRIRRADVIAFAKPNEPRPAAGPPAPKQRVPGRGRQLAADQELDRGGW